MARQRSSRVEVPPSELQNAPRAEDGMRSSSPESGRPSRGKTVSLRAIVTVDIDAANRDEVEAHQLRVAAAFRRFRRVCETAELAFSRRRPRPRPHSSRHQDLPRIDEEL